ncbi:GNAT family N-acetyltransferase [Pararhizobium sp. A13]|uniref:GNAT family N-acetyltransferase n=1 Tax=Pararhizobium sp. A13 TaxID=3133975 RepID=UPI00324CA2D1
MPAGDFAIRPAMENDLQLLLALYRHLHPDDPEMDPNLSIEQFAEMLAHPGMTVFVGLSGEMISSTVTLIVIPNLTRGGKPYALIENVVTDARFRKRGHAGALIRHAFEYAWQAGCYKVMLLTGSQDPATLKFYEGCGLVQDKTGFQIRRPACI